jgi:membrane associated rhomboid family serine protease
LCEGGKLQTYRVIDLNHILLFIAVISPLAVLARAWRPGTPYRGWRLAAGVVLTTTALAWIFFRDHAGYIGGAAWFALLFLPAVGMRRITELAARQRYKSARKLATALQLLHPSADLRQHIQLFRTLESRQAAGLVHSLSFPPEAALRERGHQLRNAPAVIALIFINLVAFGIELYFGEWSDPAVLHRLGALEPFLVIRGEYWRLLTALFLHFGPVHLLFNLFALYVLGPPLERTIGAARFCACYLISGIGSNAGVVGLALLGLTQATQLVGASGCVLGIVGAWAGFLLRHRHAPHARERLTNILMIVVIQIAFDLSTPQISMSAHLCGLIIGFLMGLIVGPRATVTIPRP